MGQAVDRAVRVVRGASAGDQGGLADHLLVDKAEIQLPDQVDPVVLAKADLLVRVDLDPHPNRSRPSKSDCFVPGSTRGPSSNSK